MSMAPENYNTALACYQLYEAHVRTGHVLGKAMQEWEARHGPTLPPTPPKRTVRGPMQIPQYKLAYNPKDIPRPGMRILQHIWKRTGVDIQTLRGKSNAWVAVGARRRASRLFARLGYTPSETARIMHRDHSTILYHLRGRKR